jgi:hypothetical protein
LDDECLRLSLSYWFGKRTNVERNAFFLPETTGRQRSCEVKFLLRRLGLLSLLCALFSAPAPAQRDPFANRLPRSTWVYLEWHGTGSLGPANQTNSLVRLWADPAFATLRELLMRQFYEGVRRNPKLATFSGEELSDLLSIFENPIAVGLLETEASPEPESGSNTQNQPWKPKGYFFVFDATGKVERLQKLYARLKAEHPATEPITSFAVGPTAVDKVVESEKTYYQAQVGNYFLRSDEIDILKELIPRFRSETVPTSSLAKTAEFQQARKQVPADALLDFFVRVPDLSKMKVPRRGAFDATALVKALRLEQIRLACGSLRLAADGTRLHSAVLGDASKGGIFDILGESRPTFATLPLAPAGTSYNASRLNLAALYQLAREAVIAASPRGQSEFQKYEAAAEMGLGMKPAEVLQLFGGEFASIQLNPGEDPASYLFAITIRDQQKVAGLLERVLASSIATEDRDGATNYIELATPYTDPQTGTQRRRFYSVAVTQDLVLAAPHKTVTREAVAALAKPPGANPSGRLASDRDFLHARAALPENLSGMAYTDLTRIHWEKIYSELIRNAKAGAQANSTPQTSAATALQGFDPAVISRYLHVFVSSTWKDSSGIYFDLLLQ